MQTLTPELTALLKSHFQAGADGYRGRFDVVGGGSYRCARISTDKSLRMQADQFEVEFENENLSLGWGLDSIFPTNTRIEIWKWYGDEANAVRSFMGLIDRVQDHRDVLSTTITGRDLFALLIDQHFRATAPQRADEDGAVRTTANGVFLSMEVSDILTAILDEVGWPTADRDIVPSSFLIDEFIIEDGSSYADAIIGSDKLTGLTGYDAWADENGVFRFAPTPASDLVQVDVVPVHTWRSGEDIVALDDTTDQYELITRVKARGPLSTLAPAWTQLWTSRKVSAPVGIWYDPSDPLYIRILDRATKRLFKMRDSDRQIVSSVYLGGVISSPLGISGDPANSAIYWVLNAPWIYGGGTSGNSVKKVRKSDNKVLATYSIPSGRWSAIKVSSSFIWLTNLDTDRFYKRSKANASAIANYQHTVSSTTQTNPSGLMIDGTTLHIFWSNGGTTARFLTCDESAPGTVTGIVKTTGSVLHGGEMNTTTHTECWGDSDSLGVVAKFSLVTPTTTEVSAEVVDTELEDELGTLAQLEDREHDTHPGDADHPYEIRRATLDLDLVTSIAQVNDAARNLLDRLGRRRRVLDAGIIGHPGIQKIDLVRVEDPITGIFQNFVIDTYRSEMNGETYLGTVSLVRGGIANDEITEPNPPPTDDGGDATEGDVFDGFVTFVTEGYGLTDSPLIGGATTGWESFDTTTASSGLGPITLLAGRTYHMVVDFEVDPMDIPTGAKQFGIGTVGGTWLFPHYSDPGGILHFEDDITMVSTSSGSFVATQPGEGHGSRPITVRFTFEDVT